MLCVFLQFQQFHGLHFYPSIDVFPVGVGTALHAQVIGDLGRSENKRVMRKHPQSTIVPSLSTLKTLCVSPSIQHTVDAPDRTQHTGSNRVLDARDEERSEEGGVVLVEVLVAALGAVEVDHGLGLCRRRGLHLLVGGILVGVGDFCGLAEATDAAA